MDITKFFLLNYFAHAATVVSYPGESTVEVFIAVVAATLLPTSGAMRGINSIVRGIPSIIRRIPSIIRRIPSIIRRIPSIIRRIPSIMQHLTLILKETDLQKAAQSGALCMVVRSQSWKPRNVRVEDVPVEDVVGKEDIREEDIVGDEDKEDVIREKAVMGEEDVKEDGVVRDIWVVETTGEHLFR
jgi:hypothetical protein